MSGICGICQPGFELNRASLEPMLAALAVAGQAERDSLGGRSIALGVLRAWPFQQVAAIPGVRVAADVELTNVGELTGALAREGLDAARMSVAEQLAWLYLHRGTDFIEQLHGAFSLAVWDEKAQRLILAIDRLGVKSLYWRREGDRLLFASRSGAIRAAQDQPAEINPTALMQYLLFSVVPAPLAIYRGVERLCPGYRLIYENGQVRKQRYWDVEYRESENRDERYWAREVREAMRAAVHRHLEGCTPETAGAYLSGGTDSSSVVAFMNEHCSPVNTFSIFFRETRFSEVNYARTTAEHFRARHHERCLKPEDALAAIPKITQYYDEPFANSSAIGAYYCALLARDTGVHTLLAGDGGDEIFAGNERYASDKRFALYHSIPGWLRRGILEPTWRLLAANGSFLSKPRRYVQRALIPNPRRLFSYDLFFNVPPEEAFESDFLAQASPEKWTEIIEGHYRAPNGASELNRQMYLDIKLALADNDLRKVVGTAELAGVQARFPLLDYRLVELAARIPTALKLKGFEKRYIFKQAMKGILPHQVLYKKKHGFGVPIGQWFFEDARLHALLQDVLGDPQTRQRGCFRREFLDRVLNQRDPEHAAIYGEPAWYLLALELWHRQHHEQLQGSVCAT